MHAEIRHLLIGDAKRLRSRLWVGENDVDFRGIFDDMKIGDQPKLAIHLDDEARS